MGSSRRSWLAALSFLLLAMPLLAQERGPRTAGDTIVYTIDPILVTATRGPRAVTQTPRPVSVVDQAQIARLAPNNVGDLFRGLPGLEITGVGPNQGRPAIRGQRGQRILLLADGLRMNNSRRQREFGELPALVDIGAVQQVEIVRGPASVLYGSDAIGGVVNVITRVPGAEGVRGSASYRYGDVEGQSRVAGRVSMRQGRFSLMAGGMHRQADPYRAPSGSFGDITLGEDVVVDGSGVRDESLDVRLGWDFSDAWNAFAKFEAYSADDAGFGSVNPAAYAPELPDIDITYPEQRFKKASFGVRSRDLGLALIDGLAVDVYGQDNERDLVFHTFIPFGPGAGVTLDNQNFTDIRSWGFRAEARKLAAERVLLTYGVDGVRDEAHGRDRNTSVVTGFGPPREDVDTRPSIPDARFRSLGAFVQGEMDVGPLVSLVGGARFQATDAETLPTADLTDAELRSASNRTVVAALNGLVHVTDELDLVASSSRGFRSPNLVEMFYDGPVPEAGAYRAPAEDLSAETSFNVDLGVRYHTGRVFLEAFVFNNTIYNGIRAEPVRDGNGDVVQRDGLDLYRNVNLEEIVFRGLEIDGHVDLDRGFSVGAGYSKLDAEDAVDPDNPVGESFSEQLTARVRWQQPGGRLWAQWDVRHSGEQKSVDLESNPLGELLPAFTVQNARAGVRLFETGGVAHALTLAVTNLTDELYAEIANAMFFRPEPKRNLTITYALSF